MGAKGGVEIMASPKSHKSYKPTAQSIRSQLAEIEKNLQKHIGQIVENVKAELDSIGNEVKEKALEITPIDTGELFMSAYQESESKDGKYTVEVGYMADHAVFAHTNANRGHDYINPTTPGTHWQFLSTALDEVESELARKIAEAARIR